MSLPNWFYNVGLRLRYWRHRDKYRWRRRVKVRPEDAIPAITDDTE